MTSAFAAAIGGLGGSGTRVVAELLKMLGYYIGDDLNEANDNLWFTLLFKRRSILIEDVASLDGLATLFLNRMNGQLALSAEQRAWIHRLAGADRIQHSREWLVERALSLTSGVTSARPGQPWGWKEPNTHILMERFLRLEPRLRYINLARHPLDMALSDNQNQLENWGPIFLDQDISKSPQLSLRYWCAAHRRIAAIARAFPRRVLALDFDEICREPKANAEAVARFLNVELTPDVITRFGAHVRRPPSAGRFRSGGLDQFDPDDLAYVAGIGYEFG